MGADDIDTGWTQMGDPQRLSFGLVPPASFLGVEPRVNAFLRWVGERARVQLVRRQARSYDELVNLLRSGDLDIAWLPPIPFARLDEEGIVRALVTAERGGVDQYVSVLLTRSDSSVFVLADVKGKRIGWVDPLSATGYVVPRMRLAARFPGANGPNPRVFASETFFGSHAAVARAILEGTVDVGATYGGFGDDGSLVRGPFLEVGADPSRLRVVEAFGAIPPDVIAVHSRIAPAIADSLAVAFEQTSKDPLALEHVHVLFGAMFFIKKPLVGYDLLRTEVEHGVDSGVIPAAAAFLSTRPPPNSSSEDS
jgi:phosphonate transport system substrate-binding protein